SITVGATPTGSAVTWSYMYDDGNRYLIPTYAMTVSGTDAQGNAVSRTFQVLRFGVYRDSPTKSPSVVGLADAQSYTIKGWEPGYKVHSFPSPEDGAWRIFGSYLIHDGPDDPMRQVYATA